MFIFSNADGTTAAGRFLYSNLCIESLRQCRQFQPCKPIRKAATSHAKQKRQGFHPYRLMFIFFQRRRHDCRRAFSLLESVHRIAPPVQTIPTLQTYPESCYISRKTKAAGLPPIPLDVYFFPTQTARLPQGVFSTRICTLNRSASVKPIRKAATSTKSKAVQFSPIPLVVYFFPTQTARLPHGVFSTRICASNRSANADT